MTWVLMQFDDAGQEPLGVWGKCGYMMREPAGISHREIVLFPTEDAAWRIVDCHHKSGEVWGVISSEMLARKLKTGRYVP